MFGEGPGVDVRRGECDTVGDSEARERKLRSLLHQQTNAKINVGGAGCDSPKRWTLRDRVENAILEGERAGRRAATAHRVRQILDQHPEFGELLDLIGEF